MKKKNLVPLIVFLLSMCLVGFIVYKTDTHEKWQRRTTAQLNVSTYGERIKNEITNGIAITDALKQVLISENGDIKQFDTIAENLISDSIESVQLAPDGVVTDIYPAEEMRQVKFICSMIKTVAEFPVMQETTIQSSHRDPLN